MISCKVTYTSIATKGGILHRAICDCGWNTGEFHVKAEAEKRAYIHLGRNKDFDLMDEQATTALERLHWTGAIQWRSADGKIWLINPPRDGAVHMGTPIMTPTHAQKCIAHMRGRQIYGPFTEEQDDLFESAPIIMAFRRRVAEANGVEWRDARWHDWMYEKKHGARPG